MKNWMRFISFMLVFCLIFTLGNQVMGHTNERWIDFYNLPKDSIDVLFLGNSHNFYSFQPKIVNDILSINAYALGTSGENVFVSYHEMREVLKYQKPKIVLLETFTVNLTDILIPGLVYQFTDAFPLNGDKVAVDARFISLADLYTVVPMLRTRLDWNNPAQFTDRLKAFVNRQNKPINPGYGYEGYPNTLRKNDYDSILNQPAIKTENSISENIEYLNKLSKLCNKNNVELWLISAPTLNFTGDQLKYFTPFDASSYAEENNLNQLKFDTTNLNELHFNDGNHINNMGSVMVSIDTALMLAEKLDIPVNQKELDYYRTFIFSDYSLVQKDDLVDFVLTPSDPDAPLEYQYTLTEIDKNIKMSTSDWQKKNDYHFSLHETGSYLLDVSIRNTAGNYVQTAAFNIYYEKPKE